jgi:hypothetical protein
VQGFKELWGLIYGIAVVAIGAVGTFLTPPPFSDALASSSIAKFVVAIAAGLFWASLASKRATVSRKAFIVWTPALLTIALGGLFAYSGLTGAWTSPSGTYPPLDSQRVVIGSRLTTSGTHAQQAFENANSGEKPTPAELMEGSREFPWDAGEVRLRALALSAMYLVLALLFSASMFTTIQALSSIGIQASEAGEQPQPVKVDA